MPKLADDAMRQRRAHIIEAALRCFMERGFAVSTVDDVCAAAGISKGALYSHFKSKDAVITAVAERRKQEFSAIEGGSYEAFERSLIDVLVKPILGNLACRFELEAMAASGSDISLHAAVLDNARTVEARVRDVLTALKEEGKIVTHLSPSQLATIMHTYLTGIVGRQAADMGDSDSDTITNIIALIRSLVGITDGAPMS